jgi:hypothetical protein
MSPTGAPTSWRVAGGGDEVEVLEDVGDVGETPASGKKSGRGGGSIGDVERSLGDVERSPGGAAGARTAREESFRERNVVPADVWEASAGQKEVWTARRRFPPRRRKSRPPARSLPGRIGDPVGSDRTTSESGRKSPRRARSLGGAPEVSAGRRNLGRPRGVWTRRRSDDDRARKEVSSNREDFSREKRSPVDVEESFPGCRRVSPVAAESPRSLQSLPSAQGARLGPGGVSPVAAESPRRARSAARARRSLPGRRRVSPARKERCSGQEESPRRARSLPGARGTRMGIEHAP